MPVAHREKPLPDVQLQEMLVVFARVLKRAENFSSHHVQLEPLSTRERMSNILDRVSASREQFISFVDLFHVEEGRRGVIVTFLAIMELIKESLLEMVQAEPFSPIHIKAGADSEEPLALRPDRSSEAQ